ncbi:hypothetical protein J3R83DRAFT_5681, partial [Lanmaoa asiatica]
SKANLKPSERMRWTGGRDGWSDVGRDGVLTLFLHSSNLVLALSCSWAFNETEGW